MSKFDWHSEPLSDETIITKTYKNTQNVRRYFYSHFGTDWKNNRNFMAWFNKNEGKTLREAVEEFKKNHYKHPSSTLSKLSALVFLLSAL